MPNFNLGALVGSGCDTFMEVAINNNELLEGNISLYPNPATNLIHVTIALQNYADYQLTIHDITGNDVFIKELLLKENEIDISNLPAGVYTYNINNNTTILKQGKLVKL